MKKITSFTIVLSILVLGVISCKKEKTAAPLPVPVASTALNSSTHKYIKFTLGGTNYNLDAPTNGAWAAGSHSIANNGGLNYFKIWNTYQPQPGFDLCFSDTTSETSTPLSDAYFRQFFTTKSYAYSPLNLMQYSNLATGIYMSTKDNANVYWSTVNSTNPSYQNGSAFTIVEKSESTQSGDISIIFKATFNCKMYSSAGDSVMLTNGEMITSFYNY